MIITFMNLFELLDISYFILTYNYYNRYLYSNIINMLFHKKNNFLWIPNN